MIEQIGDSPLVVTEEEIRLHCRIDEFEFEEQRPIIMAYARAAQDAAARITRRSIGISTYRQTVYGSASDVELSMSPLGSIISVRSGGMDLAHSIEHRNGLPIVKASSSSGMTIEYTAGYGSVPSSIHSWILLRIGALWENREENAEKVANEHEFAKHLLTPYISRLILS